MWNESIIQWFSINVITKAPIVKLLKLLKIYLIFFGITVKKNVTRIPSDPGNIFYFSYYKPIMATL